MRIKWVLAFMCTAIVIVVAVSVLKHWSVNRPPAFETANVIKSNHNHALEAPASHGDPADSRLTELEPMPVGHLAFPRVSPYAVVSQGICVPGDSPGQEEASRKKWESLLSDPFWQSIFAGVEPQKFFLVRTKVAMQRYVTYWKMQNSQPIHWTGKRITIPAGTRVFTDGHEKMFLCACGNQVAAVLPPEVPGTPGKILPPEDEPPVAYLVPPEPDSFPLTSFEPLTDIPLTTLPPPELALVPPVSDPLTAHRGSTGVVPPVVPPVDAPSILLPVPSSRSAQTAPVPETPDTLLLTLFGMGAIFIALRLRRQK